MSQFQRRVFREFRQPKQLRPGVKEWTIPAVISSADKRSHDLLVVSFGYKGEIEPKDRRVSLRICNSVAILDPLDRNALVLLLLNAATD